jgi:hypothetical protein
MNEVMKLDERARALASAWITAMLSISASVAIAFGVWIALDTADTEPLESPLILSVARQLDHGPWGLYGPFGRRNPLVLIHAPLYYHLAAILAYPLTSAGIDRITAARLAGRGLSLFALLVTAWSASRIARLDGAPARVGWWAACLFASAPVVGAIPFTVRPDMLGIALQTTGALIILKALRAERTGGLAVAGAFAAFGLAMCTKQHLVGGFSAATILVLMACRRGRVSPRLVALGVLTTAAVATAVYGTEEVATEGRMSQAVFVAAIESARVHPADWIRAAVVFSTMAGGSLCMIALGATAGLAQLARKPGARRIAAAVGTVPVAFALAMPIVHRFVGTTITLALSNGAVFVCLFIIIPACVFVDRRIVAGSRLDPALGLFGFAELVIIAPLCRGSTGAWVNYAIQGLVFAAILTARFLWRACNEARLPRLLVPIGVSAAALLAYALLEQYLTLQHRQIERRSVELVLYSLKEPTREIYFTGSPGKNRTSGRTDLVFDDWLYPVFESLHLAEPRSSWLPVALTDGSVRFVITSSNDPRIDGVNQPLTSLGYIPRLQFASIYIWEQTRFRK